MYENKRRLQDWPEWNHPADHPCMHILSFVSGMPKALRDRSRLVVMQAWFDDSGKEGINQSAVYLLAGYSAPVSVWASFADAWNAELNREPRLEYLHTYDAYHFINEFGKDKNRKESEWLKFWGPRNWDALEKRLLRFADLIIEYLKNEIGDSITWRLKWDEYHQVFDILKAHPIAESDELAKIKNPFYLSFQKVLGETLRIHAARKTSETIHILFDCGIDRIDYLKAAFSDFVKAVELGSLDPNETRRLEMLENKEPEFRDDKKNPPLQAADLLAWHLRRFANAAARGKSFDNKVWDRLQSSELRHYDMRYEAADWRRILNRMRASGTA